MSREYKTYKLEELKVGMRVKEPELSKIIGVPIYLDQNSLDYSSGYIEGTISCIGDKLGMIGDLEIYNMFDPDNLTVNEVL